MAIPRFDYPQTTPDYLEGQITSAHDPKIITLPNCGNDTKRSATITPGVGNQAVTTYRLRDNYTGQTLTITTDATPSAIEASNLIRAAIRANPVINGLAQLNADGQATVVISARVAGTEAPKFDFVDLSEGSNKLTIVTTAATDSSLIKMGRAVVSNSANPTGGKLIDALLSGTVKLRGFTGFTHFDQVYPGRDGGYYARDAVNVVTKGQQALKILSAFTPLSSVYLIATGANAGLLTAEEPVSGNQIIRGISFRDAGSAGSIARVDIDIDALEIA